jgi:hypothetical protein
MRSEENNIFHVLTLVPPHALIPVIEKGLEIQKLEFHANPNEQANECIRYSRAVLSFLYARKLGL